MQDLMAQFDEHDARRIVLIQAIELTDTRAALISDAERDRADRTVLAQRSSGRNCAPDAKWFIAARAAELLHTVESRSPALARMERRDPWWDRLAWLLPLLALAAGFSSDRLFNWSRTDLLSIPLIGVIAWNLVVYALLIASAVRKRGDTRFLRGLAEMPSWFSRRAAARLRESAALQFRLLWWRVAGAMEAARLYKLLHLSAAAWAVGVVLSIAVAGLATQFRIGWESTWLDANGVYAVLRVMELPARALGLDGFTFEQVRRLQFGPGAAPGQPEAQRWALIYICFLTATVIVPRCLLWLLAAYRVRAAGRGVTIDLSQDYFAGVLARVSPARVVLGIHANDLRLKQAVLNLLAQAGESGAGARGEAFDPALLTTEQGDRLELAAPGEPADLVWLVVESGVQPGDVALRLRDASPGNGKVLLLCEDADLVAACRQQVPADVMLLPDCGACWPLEQPLHHWLLVSITGRKRAGMDRLVKAWSAHHANRLTAAMALLGAALAASVQDSEKVRGLLPGAKERAVATSALLERMQARLDSLHAELVRLYSVPASALTHSMDDASGHGQAIGQAGAGAAGALAGALAGAKIDLLTGGLTLGAGMAVGAILGGAGVFTAARYWLLGSDVRLSDEQVQGLAEMLVMQYLATIHSGRVRDVRSTVMAPGWKSETVAAVAADAPHYQREAKRARDASVDTSGELAATLRRSTWRALGGIYAGVPLHGVGDAPAP
ncbi:DUF3482 domain-containing protein [Caenimonas koreensis]|uniref:DUF3482 domain-containing protein n=1 Tax=Caenimonas koreensis TaxID=367474 RepID=UPI003784C4EF